MTKFNLILGIVAIYLISLTFLKVPSESRPILTPQLQSSNLSPSFSKESSSPEEPTLSKSDLWRIEEYSKSVVDRISLTEEQILKLKNEFNREVNGRYLSLDQRKRVIERALGSELANDYIDAIRAELETEEIRQIDSELGRLLLKIPLSESDKKKVKDVLLESKRKLETKFRERSELLEEMMTRHFDSDKTPLQAGYRKLTELNEEIKKERLDFIFNNLPNELAREVAGVLE